MAESNTPAGHPRPLQPREDERALGGPQALPASWLVDFEGAASAEVDRLFEDQRLIQVLAAHDFGGPNWERFQAALARYGVQVLGAWLGNGTIFRRCEDRGLPTLGPRRLSAEDRQEITELTVAESIALFRKKALRAGGWDPERGASLKTYFIGRCLLQFPRNYEKWLRDEQPLDTVPDIEMLEHADLGPGPEALAEGRLVLAAALQATPALMKVARVFVLQEAGYGQAEVAKRLGLTIGAVESLLYRHRQKEGA